MFVSLHSDLFHLFLNQFDEQKDEVAVEQILRVVFLDAERPSPVSGYFTVSLSVCISYRNDRI